MKLSIFLILFISLDLFANLEIAQKESDAFVRSLKEKEIEDQLISSNKMGDCNQKASSLTNDKRKKFIEDCFEQELNNKSDDEIKSFAKDINLKEFDKKAAKSTSSIRKYLSKRFQNAIHGKDYDELKDYGTKKQKYVGQKDFFDMYETQIGKNSLMIISTYCLENLRVGKKPIKAFCQNTSSKPYTGCLFDTSTNNSNNSSNIQTKQQNNKAPRPADEKGNPISFSDLWTKKAEEVEYIKNEKSSKETQSFIKNEFELGAEYLKAKYQLCIMSINNMCNIYECNNTITDPKNKDCLSLLGQSWKPKVTTNQNNLIKVKLQSDQEKGRIACNIKSQLQDYRKTLIALEDSKDKLQKIKNSKIGYNVTSAFKGVYNKGKDNDEKSIDEITTVASKEISENKDIKELQNLDKKADSLITDCKGSDINSLSNECKDYLISQKEITNIELEFEVVTALQLKRIQTLKNDKKELELYLKKSGLDSKKFKSLSEDQLIQLISDKYKAERLAVINKLRSEFKDKTIKTTNSKNVESQIQDQIKKASEEIKSKKDRLENVLHYNNIITSFLDIEDQKTGQVSQNSTNFNMEQEGFNKFTQNNKEKKEAEKYFNNLGSQIDPQKKSESNSVVDVKVLENILGIDK